MCGAPMQEAGELVDAHKASLCPLATADPLIANCILLGGHGFDIRAHAKRSLAFQEDDLEVLHGKTVDVSIPLTDLTHLELGGPGAYRKGGGFVGGGFGLEGFAIGALVASTLNSLTTRTKVESLIGVQAGQRELIFMSSRDTPDALRIRLSRVLGRIRANAGAGESSGSRDPVDRLAKLGDLLERGLVTQSEFDDAKAKLLDSL
jgi:Short C-terminal domain